VLEGDGLSKKVVALLEQEQMGVHTINKLSSNITDLQSQLNNTQDELLSWVKMEHFKCQHCSCDNEVDARLRPRIIIFVLFHFLNIVW